MSIIFTANTTYKALINKLEEKGHVILIPSTSRLYDGVRNHTDLHIHVIGQKLFISQEIVPPFIHTELTHHKIQYTVIGKALGDKYPQTVALCAISTNTLFIHNLGHTDAELLSHVCSINSTRYNVNQGYTRCTTLPLSSNCFFDN